MIVTSHPEVILILTLEIGIQTEQFFLFALAANMLSSKLCCLMSRKRLEGTNVEDKKERQRYRILCNNTIYMSLVFTALFYQ